MIKAGFENFKITWRADVFSGAPQHSSSSLFGTIGINYFASKPKVTPKSKLLTFFQKIKNLKHFGLKQTSSKKHWERVHQTQSPDDLSWYQIYPEISLRLIKSSGAEAQDSIIDVGGGTSKLVDSLLLHGYKKITVLDISGSAIAKAKQRLKEQAQNVTWIEADITTFEPQEKYSLWHDRAVFHFLTDKESRKKYISSMKKSLKTSGHLIVATFSTGGPKKCSGLKVQRYNSETLQREFGENFELLETIEEEHITPGKVKQKFIYCHFLRRQ
ncbi:MAG TPA: class I SAM-dependent methyltransferase [Thermodesulfovibrionia bacterium]|nr:class I SAM-dependent methyltransferase [Thermodesulfovibrionia bacterium]